MSDKFSPYPEAPALVIGAAGIDLVGRLKAGLVLASSNSAEVRVSNGGTARNVAENLTRLGQPVRLITAVGDDEAGERLLTQLRQAGVETGHCLISPDYPTGAYLAAVDQDGALQVAIDDMRAVQSLSPAYLEDNASLFKDASLLFVDANLPAPTLRTAFALAQKVNIPICADPTSIQLAEKLVPLLSEMTIITPNYPEACLLYGQVGEVDRGPEPAELAKGLVSLGVEIAIVTLAHLGVCYANPHGSGQIPAIHTQITDPTGGGDALTAAVLFALLNDIPLDDAIRLGVSAASLTLSHTHTVRPDLSLEMLYNALVI